MVNLSIHGVISSASTYRTVGAYGITGPRAVDGTVGLVRYPGILPRVMLISSA